MNKKLNVARAVGSRVAHRVIRLALIIALVVFATLGVVTTLLAYFFSAWWLLLLVPIFFIAGLFLAVWFVASAIAKAVYRQKLTASQKTLIDEFVDSIVGLVEKRSVPPAVFVFICLKDLLLHRDLSTVREIVRSSSSLLPKYRQLEDELLR